MPKKNKNEITIAPKLYLPVDYLKELTKVTIIGGNHEYTGIIRSVTETGEIVLTLNLKNGELVELKPNFNYKISTVGKFGLFAVTARYRAMRVANGHCFYLFHCYNDGRILQQRQTFRLPVSQRILFKKLDTMREVYHEASLLDLSAGGARIIYMSGLDIGTKLQVVLVLGETNQQIEINAEVRSVSYASRFNMSQYGLQFTKMSGTANSVLFKYLTKEQKELRNKQQE